MSQSHAAGLRDSSSSTHSTKQAKALASERASCPLGKCRSLSSALDYMRLPLFYQTIPYPPPSCFFCLLSQVRPLACTHSSTQAAAPPAQPTL